MAPVIARGLKTRWAGGASCICAAWDSTNRYAPRAGRADGAAQGTPVVADEQTAGARPTRPGLGFPGGRGHFMTLILRPQAHPPMWRGAARCKRCWPWRARLPACARWTRAQWAQRHRLVGANGLRDAVGDERGRAERPHDVVAGIGINVHQTAFEGEIAKTASSFDLLTAGISPRGRGARVLEMNTRWWTSWSQQGRRGADGGRIAATRDARPAGRSFPLRAGFTGTAKAVTDSGSLIVPDDDGREREVSRWTYPFAGWMGYA